MKSYLFSDWCRKATRLIRYRGDRKAVFDELMAHLEDRQEALEAQGMPPDKAQREAVNAMGSADAIASELAAIHTPFWGYTFHTFRVICVILCTIALLMVGDQIFHTASYLSQYDNSTNLLRPETDQWEVLAQGKAEEVCHSDGYWFRVPNAVLWQQDDQFLLSFELQQFDGWLLGSHTYQYHRFWVEDSLGNTYTKFTNVVSTHPGFLEAHRIQLSGIPSGDMEWFAVHYDRDGRDIVLHIDLTGGDSP